MQVYIDNDQLLTVEGLYDNAAADYVNNATVTVTLTDADGAEVTGQSWPATLAYVAGSNGNYRTTLEDGLSLVDAAEYLATINVDAGSDKIAKFLVEVRAVTRYRG